MERIFEPFHQSNELAVYNGKGVGLGLAICRHIIDAHNGSLTAKHVAGRGVAFVIALPAANAADDCGSSYSQPEQAGLNVGLNKEEMAHPHF